MVPIVGDPLERSFAIVPLPSKCFGSNIQYLFEQSKHNLAAHTSVVATAGSGGIYCGIATPGLRFSAAFTLRVEASTLPEFEFSVFE